MIFKSRIIVPVKRRRFAPSRSSRPECLVEAIDCDLQTRGPGDWISAHTFLLAEMRSGRLIAGDTLSGERLRAGAFPAAALAASTARLVE